MADNFTSGGSTFRADDVGAAVLAQVVKLDVGADGVELWASGESALAALPVTPRFKRSRLAVTPTVSTTPAYSRGDAVGSVMTFTSAARASGGSGMVRGVALVDKSSEQPGLDLVLFTTTVASVTDNNVFDPTDAELATFVGLVRLPGVGGWARFNDNSATSVACEIPYLCAATSLFGVLVARDAPFPTFAAATDLVVTLTVDLD